MPSKNLKLKTTIRNLRNKEFMQLYLQLMELTEQYVTTTKNKYIERVYEEMQKDVERVKQLDVKLNTKSDTVEMRDRVHQDINDSILYLKGMVKAKMLYYIQSHRNYATYIFDKIGGLLLLKNISTIKATPSTITKIRVAIEQDSTLFNALLELDLMDRMAILFKQGEEFEQLDMQKSIEAVTATVIDKRAIRKQAIDTLIFLFECIEVNYGITEEEVWREMAMEVRGILETTYRAS